MFVPTFHHTRFFIKKKWIWHFAALFCVSWKTLCSYIINLYVIYRTCGFRKLSPFNQTKRCWICDTIYINFVVEYHTGKYNKNTEFHVKFKNSNSIKTNQIKLLFRRYLLTERIINKCHSPGLVQAL